jgi:hypothetical protein
MLYGELLSRVESSAVPERLGLALRRRTERVQRDRERAAGVSTEAIFTSSTPGGPSTAAGLA